MQCVAHVARQDPAFITIDLHGHPAKRDIRLQLLVETGDAAFDKAVRKLAEGADVLIYDAQYLPEEYAARRRGWGHSHWREAINVVMESGAKELILFHHDPDHGDACIDSIVEKSREYYPKVRAASAAVTFAQN